MFVNLWGKPHGHPLAYPAVYDLVRRLRRRTGIDFDPHWLRHTVATKWLRDGVPVEIVSNLLGHADLSTTLDVYGHLTVEDARRVLEAAGWFTARRCSCERGAADACRAGGRVGPRAAQASSSSRAPCSRARTRARLGLRVRPGRLAAPELGIRAQWAHILFGRIPQPWLKELAKRWARWRLSTGLGAASVSSGTRAISCFGLFLASPAVGVDCLDQVDRPLLERYLAYLHAEYSGRVVHTNFIGQLNLFFLAIRQHGWDDTLPANALLYPENFPRRTEQLPRALSELVMTQLEEPARLGQWKNQAHRLTTLILMRCGLRITDAVRLPLDCIVRDGDGAPYLRYLNHKMKREALVPIDEELEREIRTHHHGCVIAGRTALLCCFPDRSGTRKGRNPPTETSTGQRSTHG